LVPLSNMQCILEYFSCGFLFETFSGIFGFGTVRDANYFVKHKKYKYKHTQWNSPQSFWFWEQKAEMGIELERIHSCLASNVVQTKPKIIHTLGDGSIKS